MTRDSQRTAEQFDIWIEAGHSTRVFWRDLWRYRELFLILAWRDVAVRYKQTFAGVAWALLQPGAAILVLTLVFGKVAGLPSEGAAPYALMVATAILPWQLFATTLSSASLSIVNNSSLVSKVYFPRIIIPCSCVLVALIDLGVSFSILGSLMAWYQFGASWRLLALPAFVLLGIVASLGPSLITAALAARYRDVRFVVPFIIQFGLFVSPVAYSSAVIRDSYGDAAFLVYSLNPLVAVIDGFRWAVLGTPDSFQPAAFAVSAGVAALLALAGFLYFRSTERSLADIL